MDYRRPAAIATLFLVAGCSSVSTAHAIAAAKPSPTLPTGCAAALRLLPSSPPATERAADADVRSLGGHKGGTLAAMLDRVGGDSLNISFDLAMNTGNVTADVSAWQSDASAVRSFCH